MLGRRLEKANKIAIKRWKRAELWDFTPTFKTPFGMYRKNNVTCSCHSCKGERYSRKGKGEKHYIANRL